MIVTVMAFLLIDYSSRFSGRTVVPILG